MTEVFRQRENDLRRPITDIAGRTDYGDLVDDVARVLRTLSMIEREVAAAQRFIMRIRPDRRIDNVIDGVVITFTDITDRKRLESERLMRAELVDSSDEPSSALTGTGSSHPGMRARSASTATKATRRSART